MDGLAGLAWFEDQEACASFVIRPRYRCIVGAARGPGHEGGTFGAVDPQDFQSYEVAFTGLDLGIGKTDGAGRRWRGITPQAHRFGRGRGSSIRPEGAHAPDLPAWSRRVGVQPSGLGSGHYGDHGPWAAGLAFDLVAGDEADRVGIPLQQHVAVGCATERQAGNGRRRGWGFQWPHQAGLSNNPVHVGRGEAEPAPGFLPWIGDWPFGQGSPFALQKVLEWARGIGSRFDAEEPCGRIGGVDEKNISLAGGVPDCLRLDMAGRAFASSGECHGHGLAAGAFLSDVVDAADEVDCGGNGCRVHEIGLAQRVRATDQDGVLARGGPVNAKSTTGTADGLRFPEQRDLLLAGNCGDPAGGWDGTTDFEHEGGADDLASERGVCDVPLVWARGQTLAGGEPRHKLGGCGQVLQCEELSVQSELDRTRDQIGRSAVGPSCGQFGFRTDSGGP